MFGHLFILSLTLFVTVSAFEQGRRDQVATAEQTQELLRQALHGMHHQNNDKQGQLRGHHFDVIVLGANETLDDEDLYEEWGDESSDSEEEEDGQVERHAQTKKRTYKTANSDPW